MKKRSQKELIEIIAKELLRVSSKVNKLERKIKLFDDVFELDTDMDLQIKDDELVRFTAEFYKEICKHCGIKGLDFMGIA